MNMYEARERFRYRGRAVFGPHIDIDIDIDALWAVCPNLDERS